MNVAALIFALTGAGLSLFQGFVAVPFLGLEINLYRIWGLILSHLSETGNLISSEWGKLSGFGEKATFVVIFLLILSFLLTPFYAIMEGFRAFLCHESQEEDEKSWKELRDLSILCVFAAGILYFAADSLIKAISQGIGEGEILTGKLFPAHSMFLSHVPLIWAACFGIASACAYADMQVQNKQKQLSLQMERMQEEISNIKDSQEPQKDQSSSLN